jgi:mannosyltransferase OCH1-like enzyme
MKNRTIEWSNTLIGKLIIICVILFYAEINLTYGFLALMFTVFYFRIFFSIESDKNLIYEPDTVLISSRTIKVKRKAIPVPLTIYQTWKTKDLPPKMKECVEKLKSDNPEFDHHLYDDNDCRQFIKSNYDSDVLNAYDSLLPGAYKSDLWRYCILYKKGGIYLDIKFQCEPGFKLLEMALEDETFVLDRMFINPYLTIDPFLKLLNTPDLYEKTKDMIDKEQWKNKEVGIYNAVIATVPENPVIFKCILQIVKNVKNNYYGFNALYPTGPGLLSQKYFERNYKSKVNKFKYFNSIEGTYITNKNRKVLSHYPEYRNEQSLVTNANPKKNTYYLNLWKMKDIYLVKELGEMNKLSNNNPITIKYHNNIPILDGPQDKGPQDKGPRSVITQRFQ